MEEAVPNEDVEFEVESEESEDVVVDLDKNLGPDFKYSGQFGYWFYKILRGDSPGRHLKRDMFFFGIIEFIIGVVLLKTMNDSTYYYETDNFMQHSAVMRNFSGLMWVVGTIQVPMAIIAVFLVRYWATLCTNRFLLITLLRFYCLLLIIPFLLALWGACATIIGFRHVHLTANSKMNQLYYTAAIDFIFYLFAVIGAVFDIWAYCDDVKAGGIIEEPNGPPPLLDLSGLTMQDGVMFCIALPVASAIQFVDLVVAMLRYAVRCIAGGQRSYIVKKTTDTGEIIETTTARRSTGCCVRCYKTITRRIRQLFMHSVAPTNPLTPEEDEGKDDETAHDRLTLKLKQLREKRDSRSQAYSQDDNNVVDDNDIEQGINLHHHHHHLHGHEEGLAEPVEEAPPGFENDFKGNGNESANNGNESLSVTQFKGLWSSLESSGSFQCKLREIPSIQKLSDHMRKQGFHIVFAASDTNSRAGPSDSLLPGKEGTTSDGNITNNPSNKIDIEIGICNYRSSESDPWFLARFIIANNLFSAVMKCQQTEEVQHFVKKFLLAKALKIDTNAA